MCGDGQLWVTLCVMHAVVNCTFWFWYAVSHSHRQTYMFLFLIFVLLISHIDFAISIFVFVFGRTKGDSWIEMPVNCFHRKTNCPLSGLPHDPKGWSACQLLSQKNKLPLVWYYPNDMRRPYGSKLKCLSTVFTEKQTTSQCYQQVGAEAVRLKCLSTVFTEITDCLLLITSTFSCIGKHHHAGWCSIPHQTVSHQGIMVFSSWLGFCY